MSSMHPDVAALIGQAGSGPPPFIHIPAPDQPDQGGGASAGLEDSIQGALDQIRQAIDAPSSDPAVNLDLQKAAVTLAKVLADLHKDQQAAMGGSPALNHIRRTVGG